VEELKESVTLIAQSSMTFLLYGRSGVRIQPTIPLPKKKLRQRDESENGTHSSVTQFLRKKMSPNFIKSCHSRPIQTKIKMSNLPTWAKIALLKNSPIG